VIDGGGKGLSLDFDAMWDAAFEISDGCGLDVERIFGSRCDHLDAGWIPQSNVGGDKLALSVHDTGGKSDEPDLGVDKFMGIIRNLVQTHFHVPILAVQGQYAAIFPVI